MEKRQGCQHNRSHALYRRELTHELAEGRTARGFRREDDGANRCDECGQIVYPG